MGSEIVVGIDFGTTYSGVSWVVNGGSKTVRVINDWPNPSSTVATSDKVPTIISYENGQPSKWGFSVDNVKKDSLRWVKLLLDPKNKIGRSSEAVLTSTKLLSEMNKTPEDVAADFLRIIWNYTKEDIQKHRGSEWESIYTVKAVLTVPAIWSPLAKDKTLEIARKAGLPDEIELVTEPEAAALAVLKERCDDGDTLQVGDCFVVCDAGGGTVDLISYKITGLNPLAVEECVVGDGGLCGSVYLDQAFERYIKTLVGEGPWQYIRDKAKKKMMQEFELSIKRCYAGTNTEFSVDLPGVEDNEDEGIDDDTITLKPTALKTIFDHVIGQIMRLVEKQIDEIQDKRNKAKAILLVGGFGTNRYMYSQLSGAYKKSGIQVLQNDGAWSAISRGAALWGLENSSKTPSATKTVQARISRFSYGTVFAVPFDERKGHLFEDRRQFPNGQWMAGNQMEWVIEKGDKIEEGKHTTIHFSSTVQVGTWSRGDRPFSNDLYYCADDNPPSRKEPSVKPLCTVDYRIKCSTLRHETSYREKSTDQKYRDAHLVLIVLFGSATMNFVVGYRDKVVAVGTAQYKDEF